MSLFLNGYLCVYHNIHCLFVCLFRWIICLYPCVRFHCDFYSFFLMICIDKISLYDKVRKLFSTIFILNSLSICVCILISLVRIPIPRDVWHLLFYFWMDFKIIFYVLQKILFELLDQITQNIYIYLSRSNTFTLSILPSQAHRMSPFNVDVLYFSSYSSVNLLTEVLGHPYIKFYVATMNSIFFKLHSNTVSTKI